MSQDDRESDSSSGEGEPVVCVIVDRADLGPCSQVLRGNSLQHAQFKTKPLPERSDCFALPTCIPWKNSATTITLNERQYTIRHLAPSVFARSRPGTTARQLLATAFTRFIGSHPEYSDLSSPTSYTIYGTLLLLPPFPLSSWPAQACAEFLPALLEATKTTHAAINAPIPPSTAEGSENIVRSPISLVPLIGNFGPSVSPPVPFTDDFRQAYWTSTRQNGLTQTWAPRWTMFSARNHREKARVLSLPCVRDTRPATAVDLYVGIGYFAFSYLAAGVETVLGWDLNPWSIEGARRGAGENGFPATIGFETAGSGLRLFCEDNALARQRVERLRQSLAPVRHVNLGLLPTSRGSWETAVGCLDKTLGGWMRVHENFAVAETEVKAEAVRTSMEGIVRESGEWSAGTRVTLEEVFKVKSYAPGVMHVVVDIKVDPTKMTD